MTMRRALIALVGVAVGSALAIPTAGAAARHRSFSGSVLSNCDEQPPPPRQPFSYTESRVVSLRTPRHVSRRRASSVDVTVEFPVSSSAQVGGVALVARQGGVETTRFVVAPPGSSRIAGSASVPVSAKPGRTVEWRIAYYGQQATISGFTISQTCRPAATVSVRSKITG
jgi:hypothetical protein